MTFWFTNFGVVLLPRRVAVPRSVRYILTGMRLVVDDNENGPELDRLSVQSKFIEPLNTKRLFIDGHVLPDTGSLRLVIKQRVDSAASRPISHPTPTTSNSWISRGTIFLA